MADDAVGEKGWQDREDFVIRSNETTYVTSAIFAFGIVHA
jgi:hypothetical protein